MPLLRRDTSRKLAPTLLDDNSFVDAVRHELACGRLKAKVAEKLIVWYYTDPGRLQRELDKALPNGF